MKVDIPYRRTCAVTVVLGVLSATGCKRDVAPPHILKQFDTPAWAGEEGLLVVKTQTLESDVLLMRRRPLDPGVGELFGSQPVVHDFDAGEVIYRYDPKKELDRLETVDLRAWADATGPEWWDVQQARRVPSKMRVALITGKLNYGNREVPTKGSEIVYMAKSMSQDSNKVLIISARRQQADLETMRKWGRIKLEAFYHQAYDCDKLAPVGKPLPLPFESEEEEPRGAWAGDDKYVVYTDRYHNRVFIVHMNEMTDPE